MTTKINNVPTMPLTILQKRWLKALLSDPRVRLFSPSTMGLEDVPPLYTQDIFTYFDRYTDGDPYDNSEYISHFHTVLSALREKRRLHVKFEGHRKAIRSWVCIPYKLEYSEKDDKFRLLAKAERTNLTINIARIIDCSLAEPWSAGEYRPRSPRRETLVLELTDERNALERAMLHFSDLEKETERLKDNSYRISLRYQRDDMTELLIRVLAFGPMLRVVSPDRFIELIRERLRKQTGCGLK
jgi:predicted DNA-binding transcriptional regulator YafY